ncbi:MAG TPA: hypothetical protein VLA00_10660 [Xanthobacteraceae bacterium]|nr:hypothetical protein [Xanthobacteraceae bacterium]
MSDSKQRWRMQASFVLAAVYMLLVQALLSGLVVGAHAGAAVSVDAFGQVLCGSGSGSHAGSGQPTESGHHTPTCCTSGCTTSAAALPPPGALALDIPLAAPASTPAPARRASADTGFEPAPRNARAPPRA